MSEDKGLSSRDVVGQFYARLEQVTGASWLSAVSMYFTSDKAQEEYKWLGMAPAMRKWVGGRQAKGFREQGYIVVNDDFEATLEVPQKWLRRDKTGQLQVRINEMVDRTESHWASLISQLLTTGESEVCYDGQFFFDTDHEEGESGTQSNLIDVDISAVAAQVHGSPTAPSPEEVQEMVMLGVQQMLGFKDDQGEPINENASAFHVQVPVPYFKSAAAALKNPIIGGGNTNIMTNLDGFSFSLGVNPRLNWTNALSVIRSDGSVKPFIRQEEEEIEMDMFDDTFHHKRWLYGVNASRGVGFGYWQHAVKVRAT
jgi:phage major head subunit gpT-like protein